MADNKAFQKATSSTSGKDLVGEMSRLQARIAELEDQLTEEERRAPVSRAENDALSLVDCLEYSSDCFGIFSAVRDNAGQITDFKVEHLNRAACLTNQVPLQERLGKTLGDLVPSYRDSALFEYYRHVVETGESRDFESLVECSSGSIGEKTRAFEIRAFPYKDGLAAIWRDVSARKRSEIEVLRQRNLLRSVLNSTEDAIYLQTEDGRRILLNSAASQLLPLTTPDDSPNSVCEFANLFNEASRSDASGARTLTSGSVTRFNELISTEGGNRTFSTLNVPFQDPDGRFSGVLGISRDITEQLATEAHLRESRERLLAAVAGSMAGTFRWDIITNSLDWDENLDRLFGLPPGRSARSLDAFIALVHPDDRESVIQRCHQCASAGADFEMEFRVIWPDGSLRWIADRGKTFFDGQGRPAYMTGACVDITDRVRYEETLRNSEKRFRHLAEALPQIVYMGDTEGQIVYFNQRWTDYTGMSLEKSLGLDCLVAIHPDDVQGALEKWHVAIKEGIPYENEHRFRGSDGAYQWFLSRGIPALDENGKILFWFGTATNIHEHRLTLQRLTLQQEQLALTHTVVGAGAFEYNCQTNTTIWSPELLQLYGRDPLATEADLETWKQCLVPEDRAAMEIAVAESLVSGNLRVDFRIERPDGTIRWMHARGHVTKAEDGTPLRMIGINLDVTEQKLAEEGARQAREEAERANRAKDAFLAALSHELRTPLTPVLMTVQLLEQDDSLPNHVREDLRNVRRNVEIETRLIDDLLDLTRITRGKLPLQAESLNVHDVLHHAIETSRDDLFQAKRLHLELDLSATETAAMGDRARLGQIFWNLIKNAAKFTPQNGTITIRSSNPRPGVITVEVADTGIGISERALPHIFNAFEQGSIDVTRQFGGLGLGLAICRTLTELHGGTISATSGGPDCGSVFRVSLPAGPLIVDAPPESPADPQPAVQPVPSSRRILLVEDHEQTGRILMRLLRRFGYQVAWASTVSEARQFSELKKFDLVVSDLGLPDGTGHELMAELRDRHGLKGLALSGYGMEEDVARSLEAGFVDHLVKPVNFEKLEALLGQLMNSAGTP